MGDSNRVLPPKKIFLLTAAYVHSHKTLDRATHIHLVAYDCLAVGRPGGLKQSLTVRTVGQHSLSFFASLNPTNDQPILPRLRIVISHEGEILSVRGKSNVRIDVSGEFLRRSPQQRSAIEKLQLRIPAIAAHKIKIVSIRRETQPAVIELSRRFYLRITVRRHIPQPEACQSLVSGYAENVFAIGRDGHAHGVAGVSHLGDGNILKRSRAALLEKRIDSVRAGCNQCNHDGRDYSRTKFVLPSRRDYSRTTRGARRGKTFRRCGRNNWDRRFGRLCLLRFASRFRISLQPP